MLYYQVLENPIVQNKNSDSNWDLIMEDPELEFQDSDMESLESDSEYYVDDEFQNFLGIDSTIPSMIVVEEFDSSESESESELESECDLDIDDELGMRIENELRIHLAKDLPRAGKFINPKVLLKIVKNYFSCKNRHRQG